MKDNVIDLCGRRLELPDPDLDLKESLDQLVEVLQEGIEGGDISGIVGIIQLSDGGFTPIGIFRDPDAFHRGYFQLNALVRDMLPDFDDE